MDRAAAGKRGKLLQESVPKLQPQSAVKVTSAGRWKNPVGGNAAPKTKLPGSARDPATGVTVRVDTAAGTHKPVTVVDSPAVMQSKPGASGIPRRIQRPLIPSSPIPQGRRLQPKTPVSKSGVEKSISETGCATDGLASSADTQSCGATNVLAHSSDSRTASAAYIHASSSESQAGCALTTAIPHAPSQIEPPADVAQLQDALQTESSTAGSAVSEISTGNDEFKRLVESRNATLHDLELANDQVKVFALEIESLRAAVSKLTEENSTLTAENGDQKGKIRQLEPDVKSPNEQTVTIEERLRGVVHEREDFRTMLSELKKKNERF